MTRENAHARPTTRQGSPAAKVRSAWPVALLVTMVALAGWRVTQPEPGPGEQGGAGRERARLMERQVGDARVRIPASWIALEQAEGHATWGTPSRSHTVTLASTEASVLPLPGVVASVVEESASALPGARAIGRPQAIDVPRPAPRDDSAMLARFRVDGGGGRALHVEQVWRRDARAGLDLVATWTSEDGTWPTNGTDRVPTSNARG